MPSPGPPSSWIIAGCDPRVRIAPDVLPADARILGLNDHTSVLRCHEQLVVDPPSEFAEHRARAILASAPEVFWFRDQDPWPKEHPDCRPLHVVHATRWRGNLRDGAIPCYYTSMVAGVVLAVRRGARRIGVLGCNMVGHKTLAPYIGPINEFVGGFFAKKLRAAGVEMRNVSPPGLSTRLQIPPASLDWLAESST